MAFDDSRVVSARIGSRGAAAVNSRGASPWTQNQDAYSSLARNDTFAPSGLQNVMTNETSDSRPWLLSLAPPGPSQIYSNHDGHSQNAAVLSFLPNALIELILT